MAGQQWSAVTTAVALSPLTRPFFRSKLIAAYEALRGGVPQVRVADGRTRRPVYAALRGAGTAVVMRAAGTAVVMPGAAPS